MTTILSGALAANLAGCVSGSASTTASVDTPALRARVALLEARAARIQDINDIKRLQRAYGYYLDEGQWDDVADLFTSAATLEIGKDGVYRGQQRIRAYFRTLGNGHDGLAAGQLNEHFQEMPVITLGADGASAQGTWRDIQLTGQLGRDAFWGEGPTEVRYVKQDGVWKISGLHWFQTLHVPYASGWAKTGDTNGGHFVGDRLPPDAPPTVQYKTWPGAFTPPFHFRGTYPGLEPIKSVASPDRPVTATRLAQLEQQADRITAQDRIENLQRIYGFYLDKGLWGEAASLFTDDAQLEIQGKGIYRGRERILQYLNAVGPEGTTPGRLYDQMQLQPFTSVDVAHHTARARWHVFAQLAKHGEFAEWETGVYENEYREENGVWKISRLHFYPTMVTPYADGWGKQALSFSRYEPALAPDAPSGPASDYRHEFLTPYHYANPVRSPARAAPAPRDSMANLLNRLDAVEHEIDMAEDRASIENVQKAYGYYLATLLWDDLAGLFADNGTIEIAMRGVYVGRPAVRRNLNLYGQAGLDDGVLHNHMQFQMVINVAPDGKTAKLRSRALSMMGNYGRNATWMGGNYENAFVKIDGRWMFLHDHQVNTYFAPYETGWQDLPQRAPPGVTKSNPPDEPPTLTFDMYPKNYLLRFHYPNPVTGDTRYTSP